MCKLYSTRSVDSDPKADAQSNLSLRWSHNSYCPFLFEISINISLLFYLETRQSSTKGHQGILFLSLFLLKRLFIIYKYMNLIVNFHEG